MGADVGWATLFGQIAKASTWNIGWILAEENAEIVFLLRDLPLNIGDRSFSDSGVTLRDN